jgi:hypothetical protein
MPKALYEPCLPTRGKEVPPGADWIHEIKYDGYRLIVQRDGKRVRLYTRNGHDWTDRYPLIVEAALRNRSSSFVLDGEAVLLGVDGFQISTGGTPASMTKRSSFTPSTRWRWMGRICAPCPCISGRTIWRGCWRGGLTGFSSRRSKTVKSIRACFPRPANLVWRDLSRSAAIAPTALARRSIGSRSKTRNIQL